MNIAVKVEYIARDSRRQDIVWIRVTDRETGRVTVYQGRDEPLAPKVIAESKPRLMDCMDCHNRPSHDYRSPDAAIDLAILTGQIDPGLPVVKKAAVQAMVGTYSSDDEARKGIAGSMTDFYRKNYPAVPEQKERQFRDAILEVQTAYEQNIFPVMKADWSDYPNDIGHFIFRGCMRCHDGQHASRSGTVIPNDCRTCHIILAQGPKTSRDQVIAANGLDFRHPIDIGDAWKEGHCFECHRGVQP
jgi:hypothetical protein